LGGFGELFTVIFEGGFLGVGNVIASIGEFAETLRATIN
jgi:hypothetical protein